MSRRIITRWGIPTLGSNAWRQSSSLGDTCEQERLRQVYAREELSLRGDTMQAILDQILGKLVGFGEAKQVWLGPLLYTGGW
jgi:hypothetical protein